LEHQNRSMKQKFRTNINRKPHPIIDQRLIETGTSVVKGKSQSPGIHLKLSDILDAFPFYVILIDEHHYILQANSAVKAQLGIDHKNIVGKYCPTVIHGLDKPIDNCPLEEAVLRNQPVEREIIDPKSGHWIRSSVYPTNVFTKDGRRIFLHMVTDITDRKQAEEQLKVANEQLRNLSRHLESVREEERTNLAREIHDELGQILTGLKIDLSWISRRIIKSEEPILEKIESMNKLLDDAVQTTKRIATELRPGVLDHLGLTAAIEWQTQELEKNTEIRFKFKSSPKDITLDKGRSTAIFRICQEALINIIRHASATEVNVILKETPDEVMLRIKDNGKGIEKGKLSDPEAFGIIGMRERARAWHGEVQINSILGKGTLLVVNIPLLNNKEHDVKNINCR
jgi:PAS domain S-box-containing protein